MLIKGIQELNTKVDASAAGLSASVLQTQATANALTINGTLTINGNYTQNPGATLALEVGAAGSGDLLQINGGRVIDLAGQVLISSAPGTSITPPPGAPAVDDAQLKQMATDIVNGTGRGGHHRP
jgi:hypothetical protein